MLIITKNLVDPKIIKNLKENLNKSVVYRCTFEDNDKCVNNIIIRGNEGETKLVYFEKIENENIISVTENSK